MYDLSSSDFRNHCTVTISQDPKTGRDAFVDVACQIVIDGKPRTMSRRWNVQPFFDRIWAWLKDRGMVPAESIGGTVDEFEVSGLGSLYRSAAKFARSVTESRAVADLRSAVVKAAPYIREAAEMVPYGDQAIRIAEKAHKIVVEARRGSKQAQAKIRALTEVAEVNPVAAHAVQMMRFINTQEGRSKPVGPGYAAPTVSGLYARGLR